jgi:hypothetical protein
MVTELGQLITGGNLSSTLITVLQTVHLSFSFPTQTSADIGFPMSLQDRNIESVALAGGLLLFVD